MFVRSNCLSNRLLLRPSPWQPETRQAKTLDRRGGGWGGVSWVLVWPSPVWSIPLEDFMFLPRVQLQHARRHSRRLDLSSSTSRARCTPPKNTLRPTGIGWLRDGRALCCCCRCCCFSFAVRLHLCGWRSGWCINLIELCGASHAFWNRLPTCGTTAEWACRGWGTNFSFRTKNETPFEGFLYCCARKRLWFYYWASRLERMVLLFGHSSYPWNGYLYEHYLAWFIDVPLVDGCAGLPFFKIRTE